jgi:hypothetical protein
VSKSIAVISRDASPYPAGYTSHGADYENIPPYPAGAFNTSHGADYENIF